MSKKKEAEAFVEAVKQLDATEDKGHLSRKASKSLHKQERALGDMIGVNKLDKQMSKKLDSLSIPTSEVGAAKEAARQARSKKFENELKRKYKRLSKEDRAAADSYVEQAQITANGKAAGKRGKSSKSSKRGALAEKVSSGIKSAVKDELSLGL